MPSGGIYRVQQRLTTPCRYFVISSHEYVGMFGIPRLYRRRRTSFPPFLPMQASTSTSPTPPLPLRADPRWPRTPRVPRPPAPLSFPLSLTPPPPPPPRRVPTAAFVPPAAERGALLPATCCGCFGVATAEAAARYSSSAFCTRSRQAEATAVLPCVE